MDDREIVVTRIAPQTKRELEAVAKENKRSVTAEVAIAIEQHVARGNG